MKQQTLPGQLASHLRQVYFGGNWTCSNLRAQLQDVSWQEATQQVPQLNKIIALAYHINYYINPAIDVLEGRALTSDDKFSFDHPTPGSEQEWQALQHSWWLNVEKLAKLIEALPEKQFWAFFASEKHGNYFRNIAGIIEHAHYHLGQIAVIKKIIRAQPRSIH